MPEFRGEKWWFLLGSNPWKNITPKTNQIHDISMILLMVQKSGDHHLTCIKPLKKGRNYQPQLVNAGFPPSTVSSLSSLPCHRTKVFVFFWLRLVGWKNLRGPISARLGIWDVYTPNFSSQDVRVCFFFPASVFCWNRFHPVSVSIKGVRRDPGIRFICG